MPSLPVDNVACCACARIPHGALSNVIAASKHRALAGCKREGAVCICKTINFSTKSFITNEQYGSRNAELYYFVYVCVSIYLSTYIFNELFVFMLFWNDDYSRGLAGHMRPLTSAVRPASAECCGCVIFRPMDWWSRTVNTERHGSQKIYRPSEENRSKWVLFRIAIYRSSGYNPIFCPAVPAELPGVLMFWNPVQGLRYRVAHACGSRCTRGCKHRAQLWFTENIRLLMWIL